MENRVESDFIESVGLILQNDGLPRIAGRLLGLFVLHGGPLGFPELCRRLQVSRASISTNTRLLVDLGAIERVALPGERQDFFRLAEEPYVQLMQRFIGRANGSRNTIDRAAEGIPRNQSTKRARMADLSNFYNVLSKVGEAALEDLKVDSGHVDSERDALVAGE